MTRPWMHRPVEVKNVITGEVRIYSTQDEVSRALGYAPSVICVAVHSGKLLGKTYKLRFVDRKEVLLND